MPLYRVDQQKTITQIKPVTFTRERDLQKLFEANLESLLGVRFIDSEFTTGDRQRGRIDTLGLDQDSYPTIIEYKRSNKDNVINQGLFYLDWLVDHKGDFTLAAHDAWGPDIQIDWSRPRLILIAESFSDYDKYAVNRIGANIELWNYRLYGEDLLYLDPLFVSFGKPSKPVKTTSDVELETKEPIPIYTLEDHLANRSEAILELFEQLRDNVFTLAKEGEITEKANKQYISYKHGKNFCEIWVQASKIKVWIDISIDELDDPYRIARDVSGVGHWGTGDVEVNLERVEDIEKLMTLIEQSYQQTI